MRDEQYISIQKELRYLILGDQQAEVKELIFVLHGYGQLVNYFSQKFENNIPKNCLFIFPEGTHRFYLNGTSGRVGASWMTKELRDLDIAENTFVLTKLYAQLVSRYPKSTLSVIGFSQGGATAARWLSHTRIACKHFISWASVFPPDINMENQSIHAEKLSFVLGKSDPFYTPEAQQTAFEDYTKLGFSCYHFDGLHEINFELLKQLLL